MEKKKIVKISWAFTMLGFVQSTLYSPIIKYNFIPIKRCEYWDSGTLNKFYKFLELGSSAAEF